MKYVALIFWMLFTLMLAIFFFFPLIIAGENGWFDVPDKLLKSK